MRYFTSLTNYLWLMRGVLEGLFFEKGATKSSFCSALMGVPGSMDLRRVDSRGLMTSLPISHLMVITQG